MPIYGVDSKLKEFHTSKKDINAGKEVLPPENYRLHEEDVFEDDNRSRLPTESVQSFGSMNLDGVSSGSFDGDIMALNNNMMKARSDTMFQKSKEEEKVELKDFTIKSVIGKGSFGKVFLVQKNGFDQTYAMKSLRKDTILDYDKIESTLLEKVIL